MSDIDILEIKTEDGTVAYRCHDFLGMYMPLRLKDPMGRFNDIKTLEHKPGDLMIVSYPKVGTHWIMDSVSMLKKGKAEITQPDFTMLELTASLDSFKEKEINRLVVTHLRPNHLSPSFQEKGKFILQLRNPKDAAVSMFHHFRKAKEMKFQCSWPDFIELFACGKVPYGFFFDYYRDWQMFVLSHPDQVLIVYYEDLHKASEMLQYKYRALDKKEYLIMIQDNLPIYMFWDYKKELRRMAKFLELSLPDETFEQIAEKGNINVIRTEIMKDPKAQEIADRITDGGVLPFYRKGEIGDWKNHFTVSQDEMFEAVTAEGMKESIFKFDYSFPADTRGDSSDIALTHPYNEDPSKPNR